MINAKQIFFILLVTFGVARANDVVDASVLQQAEAGHVPAMVEIFRQAVDDKNEQELILWGSRMAVRIAQDCTHINFDTQKFFEFFETIYTLLMKDFSVEERAFIEKSIQRISTTHEATCVWNSAVTWASNKDFPNEATWIIEQLPVSKLVLLEDAGKKNEFALFYKFVISFFFNAAIS